MKSRANERARGAGDLTNLNFGNSGPELDRGSKTRTFSSFLNHFGNGRAPRPPGQEERLNDGAKQVDTSGVRSDGLLDPKIVDSAVSSLLGRYPGASVCAIGPDGLMVEMPGSVPVARHRVVRARSALNVVIAPD